MLRSRLSLGAAPTVARRIKHPSAARRKRADNGLIVFITQTRRVQILKEIFRVMSSRLRQFRWPSTMNVFAALKSGLSRCNYTSAISLKNLHPNSSLKITTPTPEQLSADETTFSGYVPVEELEIRYSTSSGPGGQNGDRVHTKVDLRFKVESAEWLNDGVRRRLIEANANKLTKDGYLVIRSEKTRSQQLNLADAMEHLRSLIWKAAEPEKKPSEETVEKMRRRLEKANRARLMEKKMKSLTKSNRQAPTEF